MKVLITTRADSRINEMTDLTHPLMRNYADKCDADFEVISESIEGLHPHWRIFKAQEKFSKYDRILIIDSDAIVMPNTPNLFGMVPYPSIGTVLEDKGSRKDNRRERVLKLQKKLGDVGWSEGYVNTGVFMMSKCHAEMLNYRVEDLPDGDENGYDDCYLSYQIKKLGYPIHELDWKFNTMSMWLEPWNGSHSRWEGYIIHAAGMGFFPQMSRTDVMRGDINIINKYTKGCSCEECKCDR